MFLIEEASELYCSPNARRALGLLVVRSPTAKCGIHTFSRIIQSLPDEWLLRGATIWNALAALPPASLCKKMALDTCAWSSSMSKAIRKRG
jgi:hypothetical protein